MQKDLPNAIRLAEGDGGGAAVRTQTTKWAYSFAKGDAEGDASKSVLLGGKGAGLAEMARLGLPVPPGFTLATDLCAYFWSHDKTLPEGLEEQTGAALARLGKVVGHAFDDPQWPLLVSVRSSPRTSMPGMMDTILNLGLNDVTVEALAKKCANARFAFDCYRRFIEIYSSVALGVPHHEFEEALEQYKEPRGINLDSELSAEDWRAVVAIFKEVATRRSGKSFPQDPCEQLWGAIRAVLTSWMNHRAIVYRELHNIPQDWGAAVVVQAMVFGNMDERCATGVAFSRNPSTGEHALYGEFLANAQGEDVVAGLRTPQSITEAAQLRAAPRRRRSKLDAQGVRQSKSLCEPARSALSRHAGHGVHDRSRRALDAADAHRQAHRLRS